MLGPHNIFLFISSFPPLINPSSGTTFFGVIAGGYFILNVSTTFPHHFSHFSSLIRAGKANTSWHCHQGPIYWTLALQLLISFFWHHLVSSYLTILTLVISHLHFLHLDIPVGFLFGWRLHLFIHLIPDKEPSLNIPLPPSTNFFGFTFSLL